MQKRHFLLPFVTALAISATACAAPHKFPMVGKARLLVIGPKQFADAIGPLVEHKNRTGMPAVFVSFEDIKSAWGAPDDDPAKIKRTIWRYATTKGTPVKYVMLVGDMSLIPCRRRTIENLPGNPDAKIWRWGYQSAELYYSNLFTRHQVNANGTVTPASTEFSSWDKNGNGLFNEQHWASDTVKFNPDQVDGCPDVAIARVPAHTPLEVSSFVGKIIRYENGGKLSSNSDKAVTLCFGRTYEDSFEMTKDIRDQSGIEKTFSPTRVSMLGLGYDKETDLPGRGSECQVGDLATFKSALQNSLWVGYLGHGSALSWDARLPNPPQSQRINSAYVLSSDMPDAANNGRLPIVFGYGCETGRHSGAPPSDEYLDVDNKKHWFWWRNADRNKEHPVVDIDTGQFWDSQVVIPTPSTYDIPENQPRNFATSWLCASSGKGAIAYFGEELVCQNDMGRDLEIRVLQNFNPKKKDCILGDA